MEKKRHRDVSSQYFDKGTYPHQKLEWTWIKDHLDFKCKRANWFGCVGLTETKSPDKTFAAKTSLSTTVDLVGKIYSI